MDQLAIATAKRKAIYELFEQGKLPLAISKAVGEQLSTVNEVLQKRGLVRPELIRSTPVLTTEEEEPLVSLLLQINHSTQQTNFNGLRKLLVKLAKVSGLIMAHYGRKWFTGFILRHSETLSGQNGTIVASKKIEKHNKKRRALRTKKGSSKDPQEKRHMEAVATVSSALGRAGHGDTSVQNILMVLRVIDDTKIMGRTTGCEDLNDVIREIVVQHRGQPEPKLHKDKDSKKQKQDTGTANGASGIDPDGNPSLVHPNGYHLDRTDSEGRNDGDHDISVQNLSVVIEDKEDDSTTNDIRKDSVQEAALLSFINEIDAGHVGIADHQSSDSSDQSALLLPRNGGLELENSLPGWSTESLTS